MRKFSRSSSRRKVANTLPEVQGLELRLLLTASGTVDENAVLVRFRDGIDAGSQLIAGTRIDESLPLVSGLFRIEVGAGLTLDDALAGYRQNANVLYAQADVEIQVDQIPNDPSFGQLWGLDNLGQSGGMTDADIDAPEAWNLTTGSSSIIVAVIDTGVDYNHPDLAANMWTNTAEIAGNGQDDDNNGYIDDIYGWDFVNNDADPMDDNRHGTHCAGTIGAVGNNGVGIAGVAWNVQMMALKFLGASGSGSTSGAIKAVDYAVANGAKILSNSWGGGGYSQALLDAIERARQAGVIFVAAAGNNSSNNDNLPHYPSNYSPDNVVSVASTDRWDNLSTFSNYGSNTVDLAAPGSSIYSTLPGNSYGFLSGTSMATPHVSGAMALVWSLFPQFTYRQVIDRVLENVDQLPSLAGRVATAGRLNVYNALVGTPEDTTGPIVTKAEWLGSNRLTGLRVTFNESIDPSTFTVEDAALTGPNGSIPLTVVDAVAGSGNKQFIVRFVKQTAAGSYRAVIGSQIADTKGNLMDQDQDTVLGEATQDQYHSLPFSLVILPKPPTSKHTLPPPSLTSASAPSGTSVKTSAGAASRDATPVASQLLAAAVNSTNHPDVKSRDERTLSSDRSVTDAPPRRELASDHRSANVTRRDPIRWSPPQVEMADVIDAAFSGFGVELSWLLATA